MDIFEYMKNYVLKYKNQLFKKKGKKLNENFINRIFLVDSKRMEDFQCEKLFEMCEWKVLCYEREGNYKICRD